MRLTQRGSLKNEMEKLKVQTVNQCVSQEMAEVLWSELADGGLRGGEFMVEPEPDSDFLSLVWREEGLLPVAMKVCDPRNDLELTRKTARQFLMRWREAVEPEAAALGILPERPNIWT